MNINEHFKLAWRNRYLISLTALFCVLSSYFIFLNQNKNSFENTIFVTFAIENQKGSNNNTAYDNLQAADQITDSIQGWFKSPALLSEINQQTNLNFGINAKKQEKNNLLISFITDNTDNSAKHTNQIISSLQKRLDQYNQKSDLKINIAFNELKTSSKSASPVIYLVAGLIIGLSISYLIALVEESFTNRLKSLSTIKKIFGKKPLDHYDSENDMIKHHEVMTHLIKHKLKGNELQILDQTRKKRFAIEIISKYTNYDQIKSHFFPKDLDKIKNNKPTLLMVELGYTKLDKLERIKQLDIETLEILVLDRLS